jgi:hypothetical protein
MEGDALGLGTCSATQLVVLRISHVKVLPIKDIEHIHRQLGAGVYAALEAKV